MHSESVVLPEIVIEPENINSVELKENYPYCTDYEFLRKPCVKVKLSNFDFNTNETVNKLKGLFRPDEQVGLAANQVNQQERIFIAKIGSENVIFINPSIVKQSVETIPSEEGCVSLPDQSWCLERHTWIEFAADSVFNETGTKLTIPTRLKGMDAVVFQHELDHLNGILIVDHEKVSTREERVKEKQQKRQQKLHQNRYGRKLARAGK